ncbi:hypothetical protein DFH09DRAFT_1319076 [Mycena vulgaris]|nr:hypothetical protein DFH09DRAFT_1319076 [Mycena vulgaris]
MLSLLFTLTTPMGLAIDMFAERWQGTPNTGMAGSSSDKVSFAAAPSHDTQLHPGDAVLVQLVLYGHGGARRVQRRARSRKDALQAPARAGARR